MSLLDAAMQFHDAGLAVLPTRTDGSKGPAVDWKAYQVTAPTRDQLVAWFDNPDRFDGLGLVTGAVSGQLEMLEAESRALHLVEELGRLMGDNGYGELWERLCAGYLEATPSGGMHWHYRVQGGPALPNTRLARRPATEEELAEKPAEKVKVLIETRGEGGFTVTAPSAGRTHPSGKAWLRLRGTPADIPTITVDERDALHAIARMLDTMPAVDAPARPLAVVGSDNGERPGDDFNARATWEDILIPHGWTRTKKMGPGYGWTRPGKDTRDGISATTGTASDGVDRLYVFSSSTEFDTETPYTKFAAYCVLNTGGDYAEGARQLRKDGYGAPSEPQRLADVLTMDNRPGQITTENGINLTPDHGEDEACEGEALPATWAKVDLSNILDGTYTPEKPSLFPRADGIHLLYPGRVHSFHGESESGKSLVAQSEAARVLKEIPGGTVAYLDFESDAAAVTGRLLELGATHHQLKTSFEYRRPDTDPRRYPADRDHYTEFISRPWTYIVLDGMTDALGVFGYGTQDNDEITAFMRFLRRITTRTGAALVIVDHVTKDAESRGRFALGGQAKMNALDGAAYTIEVKEALGRGLRGLVVARIAKDRPGGVRPHCGAFAKDRTQEAARIWVDSTAGDGIQVSVEAPEGNVGDEKKPFRPTRLMADVSTHVATFGPLTGNSVVTGLGKSKASVLKAITFLIEGGFISRNTAGQLVHLRAYDPSKDTGNGASLTLEMATGSGGSDRFRGGSVEPVNEVVPPVPASPRRGAGTGTTEEGSEQLVLEGGSGTTPEVIELTGCSRCFRPVPAHVLAALDGVCSKCRAERGEI